MRFTAPTDTERHWRGVFSAYHSIYDRKKAECDSVRWQRLCEFLDLGMAVRGILAEDAFPTSHAGVLGVHRARTAKERHRLQADLLIELAIASLQSQRNHVTTTTRQSQKSRPTAQCSIGSQPPCDLSSMGAVPRLVGAQSGQPRHLAESASVSSRGLSRELSRGCNGILRIDGPLASERHSVPSACFLSQRCSALASPHSSCSSPANNSHGQPLSLQSRGTRHETA